MEWWYPPVPEWDGLLPPVSCGERPIIDGVRTPVAYSTAVTTCREAACELATTVTLTGVRHWQVDVCKNTGVITILSWQSRLRACSDPEQLRE